MHTYNFRFFFEQALREIIMNCCRQIGAKAMTCECTDEYVGRNCEIHLLNTMEGRFQCWYGKKSSDRLEISLHKELHHIRFVRFIILISDEIPMTLSTEIVSLESIREEEHSRN